MNIDAEPLTFQVVFVPGAVRDLQVFTPSLAAWGRGCRFRLVSNGCTAAEDRLLEHVASLSPCFEFARLPGRRAWEHGDALTYLQRQETGSRFAFLDSDIFATGDFLGDLFGRGGGVDALFSCPPLWSNDRLSTLPQGFQMASGVYRQTHDGICLGGSYFAIYDNRILTECLERYGIALRLYLWEDVPAALRERLADAGLQMTLYDTAKLANILLNLDGFSCRFLTTPHLHHVGGISGAALSRRRNLYGLVSRGWSTVLPRIGRKLATWAGLHNGWRERVSPAEVRWEDARRDRRRSVCGRIYRLLQALEQGEPLSAYQNDDEELADAVRQFEDRVCEHYPQWRAWLSGQEQIADLVIEQPIERELVAA
jgi:hypothetical protein